MAVSPQEQADDVLRVTISSDGAVLPDTAELISATVRRAIDRLPGATLVFNDGDMAEQAFPLSDGPLLRPGARITLKAGYGDEETPIFSGIVVRHGITIAGENTSRLVIECQDEAVKMTVGQRSARHADKSDADVITQLVAGHGLRVEVAGLALRHAELVQHRCSDWDFLLARAEANACLVVVSDGVVRVGPPETSGACALKVTYGADLIEFHADLDAHQQYSGVQASAWDPTRQMLQECAVVAPAALNPQGNLDSAALARVLDVGTVALQSGAPQSQAALKARAQARQLRSGLSRLRGRMRFQGSALARVGELIEVAGVGERFNGSAFVTGLTHTLEDGNWITDVVFGAPPIAAAAPGIEGLHAGVVLQLEGDPAGEHRVRVSVPGAGIDSVWARLLQLRASKGHGSFFVPDVGDEVLLGWFDRDPASPVVLGSLYSSGRAPPHALADGNAMQAIVTRGQATLAFDDAGGVITVRTPGGHEMVFSDADQSVVITDRNRNRVQLGPTGITLDSAKDIRIGASGRIAVEAVGGITLASKADVQVEDLNVACQAQVAISARGGASAELSATGQTTVQGAMVMIN